MNTIKAKEFWEKNKGKIILVGGIALGVTAAVVAYKIGIKKGFNIGAYWDIMPGKEFSDTESFTLMPLNQKYWTLADLGKYGEQISEVYKDFGFSKDSVVKAGKVFIKTK